MVTINTKGLQYPWGFRQGGTNYPIEFFAVVPGAHVTRTPSACTYDVLDTDGSAISSGTAMTTGNPSTASISFAAGTYALGTGYALQFNYTVDTVAYVSPRYMFGIYINPPEPQMTDEDLTEEVHDLNDYLGDRADWSSIIEEAWGRALQKIATVENVGTGEFLDPYDLPSRLVYPVHRAEALIKVARELRYTNEDRFGLMLEDYKAERDEALADLAKVVPTLWGAGPATETAADQRSDIRSNVKSYGTKASTLDRSINTEAPFRLDTEF